MSAKEKKKYLTTGKNSFGGIPSPLPRLLTIVCTREASGRVPSIANTSSSLQEPAVSRAHGCVCFLVLFAALRPFAQQAVRARFWSHCDLVGALPFSSVRLGFFLMQWCGNTRAIKPHTDLTALNHRGLSRRSVVLNSGQLRWPCPTQGTAEGWLGTRAAGRGCWQPMGCW